VASDYRPRLEALFDALRHGVAPSDEEQASGPVVP
jgi:hypothetical protein